MVLPMGGSEAEPTCKKHPYHPQTQGVCPSCLRDKLSQVCSDMNHSSYSQTTTTAGEVLSCSSSSTVSGTASPPRRSSVISGQSQSRNRAFPYSRRRHQRNASDVMGSLSFRVCVTGNGLKKSNSVAFPGEGKSNGKKKKGFWSKLIHFNGKKERLTHSVTMKARVY
ncbi:hypothetical protein Tsubulata_001299 [Turnera subulata]|uniref:Uncharacterized protein n=1 Tax=Turnera subulata TaxID=218843 RepID=A0A9Q0FNQ2_9ROSI|nr:hypothetical protein Tsubulata_001299 [Turnera subulata]